MITPGAGSSTTGKSIWDMELDNPASFEVAISTSESTGSSGPSKNNKAKTAHKDPTFLTTSYTNYIYDALKATLVRDGGSCLAWIYPETMVVPFSAYEREGGRGKVRKVRIEGMDKFPAHIAFTGKVSQASNLDDNGPQRPSKISSVPMWKKRF